MEGVAMAQQPKVKSGVTLTFLSGVAALIGFVCACDAAGRQDPALAVLAFLAFAANLLFLIRGLGGFDQ
jgi:hypothetical protein